MTTKRHAAALRCKRVRLARTGVVSVQELDLSTEKTDKIQAKERQGMIRNVVGCFEGAAHIVSVIDAVGDERETSGMECSKFFL